MAAPINDLSLLSAAPSPSRTPVPRTNSGNPDVSFGAALHKAAKKISGGPKHAADPARQAKQSAAKAPAGAKADAAVPAEAKEATEKTAAKPGPKQKQVRDRDPSTDDADVRVPHEPTDEHEPNGEPTSLPPDAEPSKDEVPSPTKPVKKAAGNVDPTGTPQAAAEQAATPQALAESLHVAAIHTAKPATTEPAHAAAADESKNPEETKKTSPSAAPQPGVRKPVKATKPPEAGRAHASEADDADAVDGGAHRVDVHADGVATATREIPGAPANAAKAKPARAAAAGHPVGTGAPESAKTASGHHAHAGGEAAGANAAAGNAATLRAPDAPADAGPSGDDAAAAPVTTIRAPGPAVGATDANFAPIDPGALKPAPAPAAHVAAPPQPAPAAPEVRFAEANHPKIISGVHGQLLPGGGTMQIRLDPAELGPLQVTVKMRNGVMTASFETSNDQATQALGHSLAQLKTALETGGVTVEKLHVQQSAKPAEPAQQGGGNNNDARGEQSAGREQEQERQRKELLRRMWQRLSVGSDPLDMVA